MTTLATTITSLSKKLEPVGNRRTGMPIEAAQWNDLVETVSGLLSIALQQETGIRAILGAEFAPKEHDHLGAVSFDWLDADLRARVETLPVRDRDLVSALTKRVDDLAASVKRLTGENDALRQTVNQFSVNDVDRAATLRAFEQRLLKFSEVEGRVTAIDKNLSDTRAVLETVLQFRNSLDGINLQKMKNDVEDLKVATKVLNAPDGTRINVGVLQNRIKSLEDISGLGKGLDDRINVAVGGVQTRLETRLDEGTKKLRDEIVAQQDTKIADSVKQRFLTAMTEQEPKTDAKVKEAEDRLRKQLSDQLRDSLKTELDPRTKAIDDKLANLDPRITNAVTAARGEIEKAVREAVGTQVAGDVKTQLGAAETRLTTRVTAVETAFGQFTKGVPATVTTTVAAESGKLRDGILAEVQKQVGQARTAIESGIPAAVTTNVTTALADLDKRISGAVTKGVSDATLRLKTDIAVAVRDTQPEVVRAVVVQLDVPKQVSTALQATETTLRGEIAKVQAASAKDSRDLTEGVRKDLDSKITALTVLVKRPVVVTPPVNPK
jgi:hypothetical protein